MKKRQQRKPPKPSSLTQFVSKLEPRFSSMVTSNYSPVILGAVYILFAAPISFLYHQILDFGVESDFLFEYVPIAKAIAHGSLPIGGYRGPVYPLLLTILKPMAGGDYFKAGMVISLLSAAVTLSLTFKLMNRLLNPAVAASVALLMMANAYFFMYSYQVGTDMLFCALTTASVYLLLSDDKLSWWRPGASAVFGALAYLTRYNGIFLLIIPLLILVFNPWTLKMRRRVLSAGLFTAVFFVSIAPWGLYCLKEKGSFFYSENRLNIAFDIYGSNQMSREQFLFKGNPFENMSLLDLVRYDPPVFFGTLARNFVQHGLATVHDLLGWLLGIVTAVGLVLVLRRKPPGRVAAYLLLNLVFFLVLLPIHYETRYPLFMLAALLSLAGSALAFTNGKSKTGTVAISAATLAALVFYSGWNSYRINHLQISAGPGEVVEVADWFKANVPADERGSKVAARKPHIAYYTGLEYVTLPPSDSPEDLIKQLKAMKVDYLYFGRAEYSYRPQLRALIDIRRSWPGLTRIETSSNPLSVLYKLD